MAEAPTPRESGGTTSVIAARRPGAAPAGRDDPDELQRDAQPDRRSTANEIMKSTAQNTDDHTTMTMRPPFHRWW